MTVDPTLYLPSCPRCDWTGRPTANALTALAAADRHIERHRHDGSQCISCERAADIPTELQCSTCLGATAAAIARIDTEEATR